MAYFLFCGYILVFIWLLKKLPFFKTSGLTVWQLLLAFLIKVGSGIVYGLVSIYYRIIGDTWRFHYAAVKDLELLKTDPRSFFAGLDNNYAHGYDRFLSGNNSWWNDLHNTAFIKLLALIEFFTLENYYITVVVLAFIMMFGFVSLWKVFNDAFPEHKFVTLIVVFYLPSTIFWTSGIHKDGIVFFCLCIVVATVYRMLKAGKIYLSSVIYLLTGLFFILIIRNFLLVVLVPALFVWVLSVRIQKKPLAVFTIAYLLFSVFFFLSPQISPRFNLLQAVVNKQQEFLTLRGQSSVIVKKLEPDLKSFISNIPQAADLALLQPHPFSLRNIFLFLASIEIFLLLTTVLLVLFFFKRQPIRPFILFCLFFSLSLLLTIGLTVNIIGAVVRYRSIILPFLVLPLMYFIDWNKLKYIYYKYK